ncbi:MAG TPA: MFS transporter [Steroidobacteraceae bacterium]|jgi:MHS family proline/betaine transporter-like MFS transporter|nr:MFS transporter [Steroidobacteraceae bacterium]
MSASERQKQSTRRTALAGLIGNVMEWFDFAVYGYFASVIGAQFFPQSSPHAQLLLTFAVFAIGFLSRPIGGLLLGRVGDRIGRRALLILSLLLMGGATLAIGVLPTYATIGVAAPILLVTLRLLQGFSVGGEFTGSMVYTTELAPLARRGLISSATAFGTTLGFILGSGSAWLIRATLDADQVSAWGWRIPFIASVLFVVIGIPLRSKLVETEEGLRAAQQRPPLLPSLIADWRPILQTFGIVAMTNAAYYLTFTYTVDQRSKGADAADFLLANTLALFVVLISKVLGGWVSDRTGRRRLMIFLTLAMLVLIIPALHLMLTGSMWKFLAGQLLMAVPVAMALGMQGAMLTEIFPLRSRVTSMSFAYGMTLALAGGSAPLVSAWLVQELGHPIAPAWYIMGYGLLGLALLWPMKETNTRALDA